MDESHPCQLPACYLYWFGSWCPRSSGHVVSLVRNRKANRKPIRKLLKAHKNTARGGVTKVANMVNMAIPVRVSAKLELAFLRPAASTTRPPIRSVIASFGALLPSRGRQEEQWREGLTAERRQRTTESIPPPRRWWGRSDEGALQETALPSEVLHPVETRK